MAWKDTAREPFASNEDFWSSVGSSVDALATLVIATVLTLIFGWVAAISFVVPLALLVRAGLTGRRSGRYTRTLFSTQLEWRDAERQAVWSVLASAFVRPRWRLHRS